MRRTILFAAVAVLTGAFGASLVLASGGSASTARPTGAALIATETPTATATPTEALPDLIVQSITDAQLGAPCTTPAGVNVAVANIGSAVASTSTTLISAAAGGSQYLLTPQLAPGTSVTLFSSVTGIPIGDTYTATADVFNVITESNETNNSLSVVLALGTLPTCTPSPTATFTPTFTPTATFICADANGDGTVNVLDLTLVARHLGSRNGGSRYDPELDLDSDGDIDVQDLLIVLRQVGTAC